MIATLTHRQIPANSKPTAEALVAPVADVIRRTAAEAEAVRRLPQDLMTLLKDAGLFSIYTPRQFGGLEMPLPDALRVVEEVARHDGSTAWTVALGLANGVFTSMLPQHSAVRVLGNGAALIPAAPAFAVRALAVDGGYCLTGRWGYNSGAPNADWIAVPVTIFEGDQPRVGPAGAEAIFAFVAPSDVEIIDTWYVTGLRATGTQDLRVDDIFVAEDMVGHATMGPSGPVLRPVRETVMTRIPFMTLAGVAQVPPVALGLARRALEEFQQLAQTKQSAFGGPRLAEQIHAQVALARAEALVRAARTYWYYELDTLWDAAVQNAPISLEQRAAQRIASLLATEHCVAAVDMLYRRAGSSAIFQSSPLERCFRDVHTAAQHLQVQEGRWETAGRVLMGLEPGSPVL
jgi:alkylation response protein AidB-like acyl-CoA dehydrogenase